MQAAIVTQALCRRFGNFDAVKGVDLEVPVGSIYGFLGPNGAGKTTTIRMLTGLMRPTSGKITIVGLAMPADRRRIARLLGALVETPSLYDHLTGRENLDITRQLLGLPRTTVDRALDIANLRQAGDMRVGAYSLGMRQRLALCRALLGEPRVLILDEPGNGLDPDGIRDLRSMLRGLADDAGMTVFVSSHQLAEVQQMATHVGVMANGELLAQGLIADVLSSGRTRLEIRTDRPLEAGVLLASRGCKAHCEGNLVIVDAELGPDAIPDLVASLVSAGHRLWEVRQCPRSLEDLYLDLTGPLHAGRTAALAA